MHLTVSLGQDDPEYPAIICYHDEDEIIIESGDKKVTFLARELLAFLNSKASIVFDTPDGRMVH